MGKKKAYKVHTPEPKSNKISIGKISGIDVKVNAANKLGGYMPEVRTGTGVHGSPKKERKNMKQKDKILFKDYF